MKFTSYISSVLVGLESYWICSYIYAIPGVENWFDAAMRSEISRPYVYRVLVPMMSQWFHISFLPIAIFFSVAFFFACSYFYKSVDSVGVDKHDLMAFLACQVMFLVTFYQLKYYDYATAFFFALMLGLLANSKHGVFLAVFPLATLNRETTFLVIIFYAVYFWGKIPKKRYFANIAIQSIFFVSIKLFTQFAFASHSGSAIVLSPLKMAEVHIHLWPATLLMLIVFAYVFSKSTSASSFIKIGIFTIFLVQILLYFLAGEPFEIRVFAESIALCTLAFSLDNLHISYVHNSSLTDRDARPQGSR